MHTHMQTILSNSIHPFIMLPSSGDDLGVIGEPPWARKATTFVGGCCSGEMDRAEEFGWSRSRKGGGKADLLSRYGDEECARQIALLTRKLCCCAVKCRPSPIWGEKIGRRRKCREPGRRGGGRVPQVIPLYFDCPCIPRPEKGIL